MQTEKVSEKVMTVLMPVVCLTPVRVVVRSHKEEKGSDKQSTASNEDQEDQEDQEEKPSNPHNVQLMALKMPHFKQTPT